MTYQDARNLLASGQGVRRTAVYSIGAGIESGRPDLPPFLSEGLAPTRDFFAMFEVPFRFGCPWSEADQNAAKDVIVLSRALSAASGGRADTVIIVSADATAAHQSVINVLDAARRAGLTRVTFASQGSASGR